MISPTSRFARLTSALLATALVNLSVPYLAIAAERGKPREVPPPKPEPMTTRRLTDAEMRKLSGASGENPYVAGQRKWSVLRNGVDLTTGNYSISTSDITFERSYGIPVDVARSYSANNADEGPLGKGWTLSVDMQTTVGGMVKSPGLRSITTPVGYKERPLGQHDPNVPLTDEPADGVLAADSGGYEETVQRDVDGVLTSPTWDKNTTNAEHELIYIDVNGEQVPRWLLMRNDVTSLEGTVTHYEKKGYYVDGAFPQGDPNGPRTPSNVLKVTSVTDRQGNVTEYFYDDSPTGTATFQRSNGTVVEQKLMRIEMPGGRALDFTWGDGSPGKPANRVVAISDGTRTVQYRYNEQDIVDGRPLVPAGYNGPGLLTSVTTAAGRRTTYGFGDPATYDNAFGPWSGPVAENIVDRVTDPRGLTTLVKSKMGIALPTWAYPGWTDAHIKCVFTYEVRHPSGVSTVYGDSYLNPSPDYTAAASFAYSGNADQSFYGWWATGPWSGKGIEFIDCVDSGPRRILDRAALITSEFTYQNDLLVVESLFEDRSGIADGIVIGELRRPDGFYKYYHGYSQDLLQETHFHGTCASATHTDVDGNLHVYPPNQQAPSDWAVSYRTTRTQTSYNFMGNPLKRVVTERGTSTASSPWSNFNAALDFSLVSNPSTVSPGTYNRDYTTLYAYHGADKYYQEKAVRDNAGRFSYKEYFDDQSADGSKGQIQFVYDEKYSGGWLSANLADPAVWRRDIKPAHPDRFSTEYKYDDKGRAVSSDRLQATTPTYRYVRTAMDYGSDAAPYFGQLYAVTEDAGGANRITKILNYDSGGRPTLQESGSTLDGTYRQMRSTFDLDGLLQSVYRVDGTHNDRIMQTIFGTSGLSNGQPVTVIDGLSGITQQFTYQPTGGGVGKVASILETDGTHSYTVQYTYSDSADRQTARYITPSANTLWLYEKYVGITGAQSTERVPQAMVRLNESTGQRTAEEMRFWYESDGRMRMAAFAQTPRVQRPDNPNAFYSWEYPFGSRCRAIFDWDGGGHMREAHYYWDSFNESTMELTTTPIIASQGTYYDGPGGNGLLATTKQLVGGAGGWSVERSEAYQYDKYNDRLTGVDYADGIGNAHPKWDYDPSGNRTYDSVQGSGWSYDNLDRMTASPGATYTNDFLGNRRTKQVGSQTATMTWDLINRLTVLSMPSGATTYAYRADGLRTRKQSPAAVAIDADGPGLDKRIGASADAPQQQNIPSATPASTLTRYYYDGQMNFEEAFFSGTTLTKLNRFGLGPRGLEILLQRVGANPETVSFPLYDLHGNMVATLARAGQSSYTLANKRSYDVWGNVRSGAATGDPSGRYCATLGHKQDDESGLVYMRARYYDPASGRFLSEDPNMQGRNWFAYANNDPIGNSDANGRMSQAAILEIVGIMASVLQLATGVVSAAVNGVPTSTIVTKAALHAFLIGVQQFGVEMIKQGMIDFSAGAAMLAGTLSDADPKAIYGAALCSSGAKMFVIGLSIVATAAVLQQLIW